MMVKTQVMLLAAAVGIAVATGGCASSSAPAGTSPATAASAGAATASAATSSPVVSTATASADGQAGGSLPQCKPAQLAATAGPRVSEKTQMQSDILQFRNVSATACTMKGYPVINLLDTAGTKLAFNYRDGGNQMLTAKPPQRVSLAAGAVAFAGISKSTCTESVSAQASRAVAVVPGADGSYAITLPLALGFCDASDPGNAIYISPFEPTLQEVLQQP